MGVVYVALAMENLHVRAAVVRETWRKESALVGKPILSRRRNICGGDKVYKIYKNQIAKL